MSVRWPRFSCGFGVARSVVGRETWSAWSLDGVDLVQVALVCQSFWGWMDKQYQNYVATIDRLT